MGDAIMDEHNWLNSHKPAASARTHLLTAAIMWSGVGLVLACFGAKWCLQSHSGLILFLMVIAVVLGVIKAHLVLGRAAERAVKRIQSRGDGRCLGGFFSWKSWLLVLGMVAAGRILRATLPAAVVGLIYLGVGTALSLASLRFWVAWRHLDV